MADSSSLIALGEYLSLQGPGSANWRESDVDQNGPIGGIRIRHKKPELQLRSGLRQG